MNILKAFVGHSFTDDDEEVVRVILDYFSQIQELDIGFSWENAKQAESKVLAEKVMEIIEKKSIYRYLHKKRKSN